ncbi:armadillo-type protein [Pavlovales sp. CCMP2436]|nr:armadillo-type protein [Pavlovales sp. CCMP2436]
MPGNEGPSAVLPVFEAYQAARLQVVQALAELVVPPEQRSGAEGKVPSATDAAEYRELLSALENYAPTLARAVGPLCFDVVPGVQLSALVSLSRLARSSDKLSGTVAGASVLPHVLSLLSSQMVKKEVRVGAAGMLLQVLRKEEGCRQALEAGVLATLIDAFDEFEPEMKTLALWCLGTLADSSLAGASAVVDAGGARVATLCLGELQLPVLRIAASVLADIAKHEAELAVAVVGCGALEALAPLLSSRALVTGRGSPAPAAMALGLIGGYSEELAEAVVEAGALPVLAQGLRLSDAPHVRALVSNSLRALAGKSEAAAVAIAEADTLPVLQALAAQPDTGGQRTAALAALGAIATRLGEAGAYEHLREMVTQADVVPQTLPPVLHALAVLFGSSEDAGRHQAHFVAAGHMRKLQHLRAGADSVLRGAIEALNGAFPGEVVDQLQPGYEQALLDQLDNGAP